MKIANVALLDAFADAHKDASGSLRAWRREVREAQWKHPADLKAQYRNASVLGGRRVVFNIRGNRYRLDVKIDYSVGVVLIKRIGTHEEYDNWEFD